MNTEQERAAFEWWDSDEGQSPRATERIGGCYKLAQIQSYWMAWQARAALQAERAAGTQAVRAQLAQPGATECEDCGDQIPEARRLAVVGRADFCCYRDL